jgi:predicted nucleic-acid-binding Zn-ribbon protein
MGAYMSKKLEDILAEDFVCSRCKNEGAIVQKVAMPGVGLSRFIDVQHHRYVFVSCDYCGHSEVFNLTVLEGKDDLGTFFDALFSG